MLRCAVEEGDDLRSGAGVVGSKLSFSHTLGHTVFHGPRHRFEIIGVLRHVGELRFAARGIRTTLEALEEGDDLRSCTRRTGGEGVLFSAHRDALLHCPQNCLVEVIALLDVLKRIVI